MALTPPGFPVIAGGPPEAAFSIEPDLELNELNQAYDTDKKDVDGEPLTPEELTAPTGEDLYSTVQAQRDFVANYTAEMEAVNGDLGRAINLEAHITPIEGKLGRKIVNEANTPAEEVGSRRESTPASSTPIVGEEDEFEPISMVEFRTGADRDLEIEMRKTVDEAIINFISSVDENDQLLEAGLANISRALERGRELVELEDGRISLEQIEEAKRNIELSVEGEIATRLDLNDYEEASALKAEYEGSDMFDSDSEEGLRTKIIRTLSERLSSAIERGYFVDGASIIANSREFQITDDSMRTHIQVAVVIALRDRFNIKIAQNSLYLLNNEFQLAKSSGLVTADSAGLVLAGINQAIENKAIEDAHDGSWRRTSTLVENAEKYGLMSSDRREQFQRKINRVFEESVMELLLSDPVEANARLEVVARSPSLVSPKVVREFQIRVSNNIRATVVSRLGNVGVLQAANHLSRYPGENIITPKDRLEIQGLIAHDASQMILGHLAAGELSDAITVNTELLKGKGISFDQWYDIHLLTAEAIMKTASEHVGEKDFEGALHLLQKAMDGNLVSFERATELLLVIDKEIDIT